MCNAYEQHVAYAEYAALMQALELSTPAGESAADLPVADEIRIGDIGPVVVARGNGVALAPMRFGFPPPRPRASPVFNFRSEGRRFKESRRGLVIGSAFFEFTGTRYPKTKHRFSLAGAPALAIAAIWREPEPGATDEPPAFSMLTTEPGPDVAPYHDRQVVVLRPEQWADWLYLTRPEGELLRPLPPGSLAVETVRRGAD